MDRTFLLAGGTVASLVAVSAIIFAMNGLGICVFILAGISLAFETVRN